MSVEQQIRSLAVRQHGLITKDQAERLGVGQRAWYSRLRSGALMPIAPRVAALPGSQATTERRILAAVLSAGAGAIASHRSAAHLWGVLGFADVPVDLTFTGRNRSSSLPWVRVHTPTDLGDLRPVRRAGIPTTNPLRVLVDLGQVAPEATLTALQHFIFDGVVSRSAVDRAIERHARQGRHGVTALRKALAVWAIDGRPPDSCLELKMATLLRTHELPAAVFHLRVLGYEVDFAIEQHRLVLECDGWDAHGRDRRQFERDRMRDAVLMAAGWTVMRFTWAQITQRSAWVAKMVRETITARQDAPERGSRGMP